MNDSISHLELQDPSLAVVLVIAISLQVIVQYVGVPTSEVGFCVCCYVGRGQEGDTDYIYLEAVDKPGIYCYSCIVGMLSQNLYSLFLNFLFVDKTIKLWKVSERDKRVEGYNTKEENGQLRDPSCVTALRVSWFSLKIMYTEYVLNVVREGKCLC
jgi:hypothetical protein